MPVYNKPIIQTSGNLSGNGRADSPVVLKDAISLMSVTASFSGDGNNLTNILPSISESHVVYVSSDATDSGADGTLKKPFQTISGALKYIGTQISADDPVLVSLLPGTYDAFTVTRHDTYFKSDFGRDRQRAVIVNGPIVVATDGAQKYNDIIGFEGIFFNTTGVNSVPVVEISGSGKGLTYFDDCYIASNGTAECLMLNNTLTFNDKKLVLRNTTFLGQRMGPDLLSINGGDAELDTCKFYYSTGTVSTGSAISVTGDSYVVGDRCLIDIQTNDYAIDLQPNRISGSVFTNSAIGSTGASSPGLVYTTKPLTLWNILFTGNSTLKLTGSTGLAQVVYSSLNSAIPLTTTGVTMFPLTETHGTIVAASVTSSLGFSGSLSSSYLVGTIPVSKGGTGAATFTSASLLVGNTTGAFGTISPTSISGSLLVSNGTTWTSISSDSIGGVGVTGGTENYIPKWTSSTTLTSSAMYQTAGGKVGINTNSPSDELTIIGTTNSSKFQAGELYISGTNGNSGSINHISAHGDGSSYLTIQATATTSTGKKARLILSASNIVDNASGSIEYNANNIIYRTITSSNLSANQIIPINALVVKINSTVTGRVYTLATSSISTGTRVTIANFGTTYSFVVDPGLSGAPVLINTGSARDFIFLPNDEYAWFSI